MLRRLTLATTFFAIFSSGAYAQVTNSAEIVKAANWKEMETVTIELSDHEFKPKNLKLTADKPYKLVIKNTGKEDHYYTAAEFFKDAVAWRKVQTPRPAGGEVKAPYFTAVEAYKDGGIVELFIVPVKKGTYETVCTIGTHKEQGMVGTITVE